MKPRNPFTGLSLEQINERLTPENRADAIECLETRLAKATPGTAKARRTAFALQQINEGNSLDVEAAFTAGKNRKGSTSSSTGNASNGRNAGQSNGVYNETSSDTEVPTPKRSKRNPFTGLSLEQINERLTPENRADAIECLETRLAKATPGTAKARRTAFALQQINEGNSLDVEAAFTAGKNRKGSTPERAKNNATPARKTKRSAPSMVQEKEEELTDNEPILDSVNTGRDQDKHKDNLFSETQHQEPINSYRSESFRDASKIEFFHEIEDDTLLKSHGFIETDNAIENFCNAIDLEINAIKKQSNDQKIDLINGELINAESGVDLFVYQFPYKEPNLIKEDTPVTLLIGAKETAGTIVSLNDKKIKIAFKENLGQRIGFATIRIDNTYLLVALKEKLSTTHEDVDTFNLELANKVIGRDRASPIKGGEPNTYPDLNLEQTQSVAVSLSYEVSYLWGPPGTGKTHTLGRLIQNFYRLDKRVLLVSNTNIAVDLLMKSLCKILHRENDPGFTDGKILRLNTIHDKELEDTYGDFINLEKVIAIKSRELIEQKNILQKKIASIENDHAKLLAALKDFEDLALATKSVKDFTGKVAAQKNKNKKSQAKVDENKLRISELVSEREKAAKRGTLARRLLLSRSPEEINADITKLEKENQRELDKIKNRETEDRDLKKRLSLAIAQEETLKAKVSDLNEKEIKSQTDVLQKQLKDLGVEVKELDEKIGKIKSTILKECQILGLTATQGYLKAEDLTAFDTVVIDEASMLPLPVVFYMAGMALQNVVVTGDFRQLPPIVIARKNEGVINWIGKNIFEKAGIAKAVRAKQLPKNLVSLKTQYRMRAEICDLVNQRFYDLMLQTSSEVDKEYSSAKPIFPDFFSDALTVIDTSKEYPFANIKPRTFSKYNVLHALAIRNLCAYLQKDEFLNDIGDLGIITPFAAQAELITKLIEEKGLITIETGTVHRFQGNEKKTIILDLVESFGNLYTSKLVDDVKLLNVALSRAKFHLVVVVNLDYLNNRLSDASALRSVIYEMVNKGKTIPVKEIIEHGPSEFSVQFPNPSIPQNEIDTKDTKFFDQSSFDDAVTIDVMNAKKWVVIFSGFSTPNRIAAWSDLFRQKVSEGVKILCVTRSPNNQGSIPSEHAREAIEQLAKLGVEVDLRHEIHEKSVLIDGEILWHGSLNPLSHTGRTEESMLRIPSAAFCELKAKFEIYKRGFKNDDSPFDIITKKQNPDCPECHSLVTFHHRGRYGPYFHCENCDWKANADQYEARANQGPRQSQSREQSPQETKICDQCGLTMVLREGRFGQFYGCSGYPTCKNTEQIKAKKADSKKKVKKKKVAPRKI